MINRRFMAVVVLLATLTAISACSHPRLPVHSFGKTSGDDTPECRLPVSKRVGGWMCPSEGQIGIQAVTGFSTSAVDYDGCHPSNYACAIGMLKQQYENYGEGDVTLGHFAVRTKWSLDGRKISSNITTQNSRSESSLQYITSIYRVKSDHHTRGDELRDQYQIRHEGPRTGEITVKDTLTAFSTAGQSNNYSAVTETTFTLSGYSGYWYVWYFSPVYACSQNNSCIMQNYTVNSSYGYGWNPNN